ELINLFQFEDSLIQVLNIQLIQDSVIENKDDYIIKSNNEKQNMYEANL
ncbi:10789_t:CDS:1, partial [Scutellospora calospora]